MTEEDFQREWQLVSGRNLPNRETLLHANLAYCAAMERGYGGLDAWVRAIQDFYGGKPLWAK